MTKKELYTCDICHTLKSQTLDIMHISIYHAKSKWSFQMGQNIGTDNKELRGAE